MAIAIPLLTGLFKGIFIVAGEMFLYALLEDG